MKSKSLFLLLLLVGGGYLAYRALSKPALGAFDPWIYDANNDGYISMSEALQAMNDFKFPPEGRITLTGGLNAQR